MTYKKCTDWLRGIEEGDCLLDVKCGYISADIGDMGFNVFVNEVRRHYGMDYLIKCYEYDDHYRIRFKKEGY